MYKEEREEVEFDTNRRRNKFIRELNRALDANKSLTKKEYRELEDLFS